MGDTKVVNGGRIRKVTLTEIKDGEDWDWPNNDIEDMEAIIERTTEEVFAVLDDVVTDWKIKLEVIVGDGLKKIKKSSKEKKTMMKYLPGDGIKEGQEILARSKGEMLNDWKNEVARAINETHNKLNDLGSNKVKDVVKVSEGIIKKAGVKKAEGTNEEKRDSILCGGAYLDLKQLMRDLDLLYQQYSFGGAHYNKVPIYSVAMNGDKEIPRTRNAPFPWWRPMCTLANMVDMPQKNALAVLENDKEMAEILQDFVADQVPYKSLLDEWFQSQTTQKKSLCRTAPKKDMMRPRRGSKSVLKRKEKKVMKQKKEYCLKEYEVKGEKHYIVVQKEAKNAKDEVEDIFADWKKNFAGIKRPRSLKPRVRRISHRQERKELLKQVEEEEAKAIGPLTYSQMLKKGLKLPKEDDMVEDIFQSWRMYLEELSDIVKEKNDKKEYGDELDYFKVWKYNLHVPENRLEDLDILASSHPSILPNLDCGQPTIKKAVIKKTEVKIPSPKAPIINTKKRNSKQAAALEGKVSRASINKKGETPKPSNIPIPPPPPPPPQAKKAYDPVKPHMQIVPFVEKKPMQASTVPSVIPLHDQTEKLVNLKPKVDFKPSEHSQRQLKIETVVKVEGEKVAKSQPTAQQIYELSKETSKTPTWRSMLLPKNEASGRGEEKMKLPSKPEEVFESWRYIFSEENTKKKVVKRVDTYDDLNIFREWAAINLKEPEMRKRRESEMNESPKTTKREVRKLIKTENIEEDIIELKENRRHDFAKNASIKDKKRGEASRKSLGKRIK